MIIGTNGKDQNERVTKVDQILHCQMYREEGHFGFVFLSSGCYKKFL